jgi:ketosteroid isomerase-like protein
MTAADPTAVVAAMQGWWASAFAARDFARLVELYASDALFFGSAPDLCADTASIRAYFDGLPAGIELVDFPDLVARPIGAGAVMASGFWTFALKGERLDFRLSWLLADRGAGWRIVQHHAGMKPAAKL